MNNNFTSFDEKIRLARPSSRESYPGPTDSGALPKPVRGYRLFEQKDRLSQNLGYIIDIRVEFSFHYARNYLKTSASGQRLL